jgi:RNA polymerase sigma-70 factor (ECF subfamily)
LTSAQIEREFNRHKDAIYRAMLRVCDHQQDAEDALAASLLAALQSAHQIQDAQAIRGWISTVGRRICGRMRSRPAFAELFADPLLTEAMPSSADEMELGVLKGCVRAAVENLPISYREVYMACEIMEESVPDVAKRLGLTVAATKSRLFRARAKVRESLDHSICGT